MYLNYYLVSSSTEWGNTDKTGKIELTMSSEVNIALKEVEKINRTLTTFDYNKKHKER